MTTIIGKDNKKEISEEEKAKLIQEQLKDIALKKVAEELNKQAQFFSTIAILCALATIGKNGELLDIYKEQFVKSLESLKANPALTLLPAELLKAIDFNASLDNVVEPYLQTLEIIKKAVTVPETKENAEG